MKVPSGAAYTSESALASDSISTFWPVAAASATASEISVSVPVSEDPDPGGTPSSGVCAYAGGADSGADMSAAATAVVTAVTRVARRTAIGLGVVDRTDAPLRSVRVAAPLPCAAALAESVPDRCAGGNPLGDVKNLESSG